MSSDTLRVAIAGATGYGGIELIRLVSRHPQAQITYLASTTASGNRLEDIYPHMAGDEHSFDTSLRLFEPDEIARAADVMLMALPAGKSAAVVPALLDAGLKVVDGGPDFRLKDPAAYPRWYAFEHPAPGLLGEAVFGIPELHRQQIRSARLVAQPGCYPTAAILAFAPLAQAGMIKLDVIVDAKSGLSGAGRTKLTLPYHYTEATEDVCAYGLPAHRHLPEIEQELGLMMGTTPSVLFAPHLVPMVRGILATVYVELSDRVERANGQEQLLDCMRSFYQGSPFVHVTEELPHTKWTQGTNHAFVSARICGDGRRAVLVSAIDNLGKGLSGEMVQCMNLMFGIDEAAGLKQRAVYP